MLPLIRSLFSEPNPGPVKAALAIQGRILEELRLPMTPMSAAGKKNLANALEQAMALPIQRTLPGQACASLEITHQAS
jgi:4-hydroxy-tetrahydrodipicolinate synthase